MPPTLRALNRATLARQLLLVREPLAVPAAVGRVMALQAQEPAAPYIALWNRIDGFAPAELDRAYAERAVVRGSLMRVAIHAVAAGDYPALREAMQITLRAARLYDRRFKVAGLSIPETDALIPELVEHLSEARTSEEVEAWLDGRIGVRPRPGVWWAVRHYGPFLRAPTGGPWSFARQAWLAAPEWRLPGDFEASMETLVCRYLAAFGPATVQDVMRFGMINADPVKAAVSTLLGRGAVVTLDGGGRLLDVPDGLLPPEDAPAPPRLLGMWDEVLLAYRERGRLVPEAYRKHVIRINGDVLPTVLVDGSVAGAWRAVPDGIEVTAFEALDRGTWTALEAEAAALRALLADRDPLVFARYGHWWDKGLPSAEVRVLGD